MALFEAVKVRLDPTPRQARLLESHAGAARFAYNLMLNHVQDQLASGEAPDWTMYAMRRWWNEHKNDLAPWWRENSKEAYNSAFEWLAQALKNWSDSKKGKRAGCKVGWPKYKAKRSSVPRFAYTTGFNLIDGDPKALRLPRIGRVHCMENVTVRVNGARVLNMTISRRGGCWYAALTVERDEPTVKQAPKGGAVGIDLGIKHLATLSDGTVIPNPHHLQADEQRLKRAQKALSRKTKGSKRRAKARERVARIHARVANRRSDALNKLTTRLAQAYSDICIEDLNVAGMMKNHHLAKAVQDASFYELRHQLEYKTAKTGARLHFVDRWCPSSKTCSNCGSVKAKLSLNERVYRCEHCGLTIDRDLNAAINIMVAGSAPETVNAHGGTVRRSNHHGCATLDPVKCEPSGHDSAVRLGAGGRKTTLQAGTN